MSNLFDEHEVWHEDELTGYIPDDDDWEDDEDEDEDDEDYEDDFRDERYDRNEQLE